MNAFWNGFWATAGVTAFSLLTFLVTLILAWLASRRG